MAYTTRNKYTVTAAKVTEGADLTVFTATIEWTHGIFGTHEEERVVITVRSDDETLVIWSNGIVRSFQDAFSEDEELAETVEMAMFEVA